MRSSIASLRALVVSSEGLKTCEEMLQNQVVPLSNLKLVSTACIFFY